jgi:hypothetical protein
MIKCLYPIIKGQLRFIGLDCTFQARAGFEILNLNGQVLDVG